MNRFKIKQDGIWSDIDLSSTSILEMYFPLLKVSMVQCIAGANKSTTVSPNIQHVTKLLSSCVDHIDILLEDWYPTIGTRFVHTSEGKFLVTRLVPCPKCIDRTQIVFSRIKTKSIDSINSFGSQQSNENGIENHLNGTMQQFKNSVYNYVWTIEECVLSTYDKKMLVCPIHGDIPVQQIAPDLVKYLLDLYILSHIVAQFY